MDEHDLVSEVKRLAVELGRTPTRTEFCSRVRGGPYQLTRLGGFTVLLQRAGLDTYDERRSGKAKALTNQIFERPIDKHLEEYKPRELVLADIQPCPSLATISDIHWPFENRRVLARFYEYVGDVKPLHAILNGDAWDMYSHMKFPRSHNVFTPREEQARARKSNEDFWIEVKRRHPEIICTQMMGNHDVRPLKRIMESYPEAEDWIAEKIKTLFTFPDVRTIHDPREELVLGGTLVFHGYRTQLGAHRDYTLYNTINGHTHRGGVVFRRIRGQTLWELNSGLAGDPEAKGLTYTPQKITEWTPGFGSVDPIGPRFIPV